MTGSCLVLTTPDAERTMNTCLAISSEYSLDNINFDHLALSKYLYIEGYLVTSELAMEAIEKSIKFSRKNDVKIALTVSWSSRKRNYISYIFHSSYKLD